MKCCRRHREVFSRSRERVLNRSKMFLVSFYHLQAIEYIHSRTTTTMAFILCLLLLCFVGSGCSHNEIFENYLRSEKSFISDLESFIDSQESVLQLLRKKLLNFKVEHSEAVENFGEYFSNELNKFLLIKRLALDVDRLADKTFEVANEFKLKVKAFRSAQALPSENDLMLSALSIAELQKTQNLRTDKLAKGIFGNVKRR